MLLWEDFDVYAKHGLNKQTRAETARDLTTVHFIYLDSYDLSGTGTSLIGGILGRSVPSGEHM